MGRVAFMWAGSSCRRWQTIWLYFSIGDYPIDGHCWMRFWQRIEYSPADILRTRIWRKKNKTHVITEPQSDTIIDDISHPSIFATKLHQVTYNVPHLKWNAERFLSNSRLCSLVAQLYIFIMWIECEIGNLETLLPLSIDNTFAVHFAG